MFETNDYPETHTPALPESALARFRELRDAIAKQSLIVWGEHCSECGFPHCYTTCAYFTPRKDDLNCGRFVRGIQRGKVGSLRLSTIEFRKWGKLWGQGPVGLVPPVAAERRERTGDLLTRGVVRWTPSLVLRRAEWEANQWKRRESARNPEQPDAFVVEAWLPERYRKFSFTLTLIPAADAAAGLFQTKLEFGPGYNRRFVAAREIAARVDLTAPYQIQLEPLEDSIGQEITFGLTEFVTLRGHVEDVRPLAATAPRSQSSAAPKVKCVVWDLDNTLWKGTLAEDGIEGLTLDTTVRGLIEDLDRRGILQSIASKNDPKPALEALEAFGIREYFLYPQISWDPKSAGLERIAGALDIGLDTFAFVDDQPFERGEVGERLPQVMVVADSAMADLLEHPRFDVPVTTESQQRRAMYQAEEQRKSHFEVAAGDYVEFLRGCEIIVEAFPLSPESIERAHELSQRTNQLNVSGQRYARNELVAMQADDATAIAYLFSCRDRFGAYGTIAMCVMKRDEAEVESFMMSCRVQRKRVEHAVFSWILAQCRKSGFDLLKVVYRKTKRNDAAVKMLQELGFEFRPMPDGETGTFVLSTAATITEDDVVSLTDLTQRSTTRAVETA